MITLPYDVLFVLPQYLPDLASLLALRHTNRQFHSICSSQPPAVYHTMLAQQLPQHYIRAAIVAHRAAAIDAETLSRLLDTSPPEWLMADLCAHVMFRHPLSLDDVVAIFRVFTRTLEPAAAAAASPYERPLAPLSRVVEFWVYTSLFVAGGGKEGGELRQLFLRRRAHGTSVRWHDALDSAAAMGLVLEAAAEGRGVVLEDVEKTLRVFIADAEQVDVVYKRARESLASY